MYVSVVWYTRIAYDSTNRSRLDWTDQMIETRKILYVILNTNLLIIIRNLIISFCSCVFTILQFFLFFFGLFQFFEFLLFESELWTNVRTFVRSKNHHFMISIFLEVRFVCIFRMHQIWFDTALSWEQFWCIRKMQQNALLEKKIERRFCVRSQLWFE